MIKLITLRQKNEWKEIVQRSFEYDFYHTWDYHSLSKEGNPLLFVYHETEDFIAFPLLKRKIPDSEFYDLTCVYGYTGPISNKRFQFISDEMSANFKREFIQFLKNNKIVSVFSRLHPLFDQLPLMRQFSGIYDNGKVVMVNLRQSLEKQRSRYKGRLFGKIKKLKRLGFYVREARDADALKEFSAIYIENMERVGAASCYRFPQEYFRNFLSSTEIKSKLIMVYHGEAAVCGALVTFTTTVIQAHLLATKTAYMKYSPAKLITDEITLIGRELGMHYLNLGGGYGFKQDSLFEFKGLFSDLFYDYKSWRYIVDQQTYQSLIQKTNIDPEKEVDFFPLYRYKEHCSVLESTTTAVSELIVR